MMIQHLKTFKATIIIGILLMSFTPFLVTTNSAAPTKLITFHSYMDLQYNDTALNKPLEIDVAISVPITIIFWTDIPKIISKIFPFPFDNLILFGTPVGPMQKIHLELLQQPDWANIYFSSSDIIMEIPFQEDGKYQMTTNLIISPKVEAPSESQRISIVVSCDKLKRLSNYTFQKDISFTPMFIPTIAIETESPIRTVGPHSAVSFQITVKNLGNKITRVTPTIIGGDKWTTTINPPNYEINPNSESTFAFSLITPYDFGWHNEYGRFQVNFFYEVYPYRSGSPTANESIYLVVNNNGFSLPGFEFSAVIIAFLAVFVILQKRRKRN